MAYKDPEKRKAYMREYNARPERKAYMREYDARPERKAYKREHDARPERKAYKREYNARPERKAKRRERDAERYWRSRDSAGVGWVYFIRYPQVARVKVGHALSLHGRLGQHSSSSPCDGKVILRVRGPVRLEREVQAHLTEHAVRVVIRDRWKEYGGDEFYHEAPALELVAYYREHGRFPWGDAEVDAIDDIEEVEVHDEAPAVDEPLLPFMESS